jgi:hypothetical protein
MLRKLRRVRRIVDMVAGGTVVEQWVAVVVVAIEASTKPPGRRKRGRCSLSFLASPLEEQKGDDNTSVDLNIYFF